MAINSYDKGDLVKVAAVFANSAGTEIDPAVVKCQYTPPSGSAVTKTYGVDDEVVKSDTGTYYMNIDANVAGTWFYRWYSTGNGQAADEWQFKVDGAVCA